MEINDQTFQLLLERFDRVDKDNQEIKDALATHVKDDNTAHDIVTRHSTYWNLLLWISGASLVGIIGVFAKGLIK